MCVGCSPQAGQQACSRASSSRQQAHQAAGTSDSSPLCLSFERTARPQYAIFSGVAGGLVVWPGLFDVVILVCGIIPAY